LELIIKKKLEPSICIGLLYKTFAYRILRFIFYRRLHNSRNFVHISSDPFSKSPFSTVWFQSVWKIRTPLSGPSKTAASKSRYKSLHSIQEDSIGDIMGSLCPTRPLRLWIQLIKSRRNDTGYLSRTEMNKIIYVIYSNLCCLDTKCLCTAINPVRKPVPRRPRILPGARG